MLKVDYEALSGSYHIGSGTGAHKIGDVKVFLVNHDFVLACYRIRSGAGANNIGKLKTLVVDQHHVVSAWLRTQAPILCRYGCDSMPKRHHAHPQLSL